MSIKPKIDNIGCIRTEYLNAFESFLRTNLIKVFSGQQRVGESYIFKQCMHHLQAWDLDDLYRYAFRENAYKKWRISRLVSFGLRV